MSAPWLWGASANWCEQKLRFLTLYEQQTKGFVMARQSRKELSVMNFISLEMFSAWELWGWNGRLRSLEWNLYICPLWQTTALSGEEGLPKDTGSCGIPASHGINHFMFMELVPIFNPSPWCTPMADDFYCIFVVLVLQRSHFCWTFSDGTLMQSNIFEHIVSSPPVW